MQCFGAALCFSSGLRWSWSGSVAVLSEPCRLFTCALMRWYVMVPWCADCA